MPSSIAWASILGRRLSSLAHPNPWTWVAVINTVQTLGALFVTHLFGLRFGEVAIPIILLILGTSVAVVFLSFDRLNSFGLKWWIPVIIYALFIFSLSARSYPEAFPRFNTKLFHPIEYLTLAIFLCGAWHHLIRSRGTFFFIICVQISGIIYAASDEFHQSFVAGRTATVTDVLIDAVGVALGCAIFLLARYTRKLINSR